MSLDATRWAATQLCPKSLDKFVLVMMADRADETHCCFPSIKRLCLDTQMDRKTVMAGLKRLVGCGLIRDTGKRKGSTGKVKVYQLVGVLDRHARVKQKANHPVKGCITNAGSENSAVITSKATSKSNRPVNGMITSTAPNGTECGTFNGVEYGTFNGTVDGTQNLSVEPTKESINLKKEKVKKPKTEKYKGIELTNLPDGLTIQSAKNFIDHRKAIKKPLTQHGFSLYLSAIQTCTDCGLSLNQIVDETIDAGWQSIKPAWLKNRLNPPSKLLGYRNPQDDNRPRKELVG